MVKIVIFKMAKAHYFMFSSSEKTKLPKHAKLITSFEDDSTAPHNQKLMSLVERANQEAKERNLGEIQFFS